MVPRIESPAAAPGSSSGIVVRKLPSPISSSLPLAAAAFIAACSAGPSSAAPLPIAPKSRAERCSASLSSTVRGMPPGKGTVMVPLAAVEDRDAAGLSKPSSRLARADWQRQRRGAADLGGVEAQRVAELLLHLLQRGDLVVQLVVQGAGAEDAVLLEVAGAGDGQVAAERDAARAAGAASNTTLPPSEAPAPVTAVARRQHEAIEADLEIRRGEDGEGIGEVRLGTIGQVLHARRDIADPDVLVHRAKDSEKGV